MFSKEHDYAIKKCSLTKSPKFVLDELKNESEILMQLKNIKEGKRNELV